jgi:hypothetical protein
MKVAYDKKLMRPACVLVAAAMGADPAAASEFDAQDWLLAPTTDMRVYETTLPQLMKLIIMTRAARPTTAGPTSRGPR